MELTVLCLMILKVTSRIARWGRLLFLPLFGCSSSPLPVTKPVVCCFLLFILSAAPVSAAPELVSDTSVATAGYYQLSWRGDAENYQLLESGNSDFSDSRLVYQGNDLATVISGKADGVYYYRVTETGDYSAANSNIIKVSVTHHPLTHAWLFFLAGAIVFIATLILIVMGSRFHEQE